MTTAGHWKSLGYSGAATRYCIGEIVGKDRFQPGGSKDRGPKFVKLDRYLLNSAAWRDLDPVARALYVEVRQRFNGVNNGTIGLGAREAGEALNVSKDTALRAFDNLVEHGFLEVAQLSGFNQKRLTREWLLTTEKDDRNGDLARKQFTTWRPIEKNIGASQGRIGASQGQHLPGNPEHSAHRPSGAPVSSKVVKLQAHVRDTYRSTTGGAA